MKGKDAVADNSKSETSLPPVIGKSKTPSIVKGEAMVSSVQPKRPYIINAQVGSTAAVASDDYTDSHNAVMPISMAYKDHGVGGTGQEQ